MQEFLNKLPEEWKNLLQQLPIKAYPAMTFEGTTQSYVAYPYDDAASRIGVWLKRKQFYIYEAGAKVLPPGVRQNKNGGVSIPFGDDIPAAWQKATQCIAWDVLSSNRS